MRSALLLTEHPTDAAGEAPAGPSDDAQTVRRVADHIAEAVDDVVVTCRADRRPELVDALDGTEARLAADPVPDEGAIAGMRTGLRVTAGDAVAVVACDDSRVDTELLERLFEACETAAVPRVGGCLHPLHAVYDATVAREACERTLATGSRRLYDMLSRVDPTVVDADSDARLADADLASPGAATLDGLEG
jgi:molybdopterin-guanine dinucleotide biosynthesis protein A